MFSFWNRRGNKSPAAERSSNPPPAPDTSSDIHRATSRPPQHLNSPPQEDTSPPGQPPPEPVVAAISTPHDAAISEVHGKLLQVEQFSPTARPAHTSDDPLTNAPSPPNSPPDPLFDPATGAPRGFLEAHSASEQSGDSEQLRDEAWAHLARIRELQSEIAAMHMHMEGVGDGSGSTDVEVDADIDVDTVPTQEEEESAKREKEFAKLPGRFKGRSDNIDAMMAKLSDLSQAVTSFHALQPPPLNFDSAPNTRDNTMHDGPQQHGEHAAPLTVRTRQGMPPASTLGPGVGPDQNQIAQVLHDSPVFTHASLQVD